MNFSKRYKHRRKPFNIASVLWVFFLGSLLSIPAEYLFDLSGIYFRYWGGLLPVSLDLLRIYFNTRERVFVKEPLESFRSRAPGSTESPYRQTGEGVVVREGFSPLLFQNGETSESFANTNSRGEEDGEE